MAPAAPERPSGPVTLVLGAPAAVDTWLRDAHGETRPLVIVTHDREALARVPAGAAVLELEELLTDGVAAIEEAWDRGVAIWLERLFPAIGALELGRLLTVSMFFQPELRERIDAVAFSAALFRRYDIACLALAGPPPLLAATVSAEAKRRGIPIEGSSPGVGIRRVRGSLKAFALLGRELVRGVTRFVDSRARARELSQIATTSESPALWVAFSGRWRATSRHVVENVLEESARRGVPCGVLFVHDFGQARAPEAGALDELALFDGTWARERPAAIDQATAVVHFDDLLRVIARWLPAAGAACVRALAAVDTLRVDGAVASVPSDLPALLRVATYTLWRALEAEYATARFLARRGAPRLVAFGAPLLGEVQTVDRLLQASGAITVDYAHGTACEANTRTHWRSISTHHASWTCLEAPRFAAMHTHASCEGGYMPGLRPVATRPSSRRRILVTTNYLHPLYVGDMRMLAAKHARRLARALLGASAALGDDVQFVLRPHPAEDRTGWRELLGGSSSIVLSDEPSLMNDLAEATVVLSTKTSAVLEAVAAGLPALLHRGLAVEPGSLFSHFPSSRWFGSADELVERVRPLLGASPDLTPERELLEACFGPGGRPKPLFDHLDRLSSGVTSPARERDVTRRGA